MHKVSIKGRPNPLFPAKPHTITPYSSNSGSSISRSVEPTWSDLSHHLHPSIIRISFGSCCIRACVSAYLGSFLHAGCPVASSTEEGPGCTSSTPPLVDHAARINMPVVDNTPSSSQSSNLGTDRQMSSIPIAASELPKHQQGGSDVWMYPSEQQFYNAMKRKVCCKKQVFASHYPASTFAPY